MRSATEGAAVVEMKQAQQAAVDGESAGQPEEPQAAQAEGGGEGEEVVVEVKAGFLMQQRSAEFTAAAATGMRAPASHITKSGRKQVAPPTLRRLKSGQVTTAAHGKISLESISFDHGEDTYGDRKLEAFKWCLLIACGLLTGVIGWALTRLQLFFVERKINVSEGAENEHGAAVGTLVFIGISCGMVTFAGVLVIFVGPLAQGSGIPLLLAYLNGNAVPNFLSPRTFLTKFLGLIFCIAGGLPLGIEGPFIHMGALSASFVSGLPRRLGYTGRYATDVARASSMRRLVACGGAAGVAAAFNAPIAGVLFVQHDASAFWTPAVTLRSFVCCTAASFSLNVLLSKFGLVMHGHTLIDFKGTRDFTYVSRPLAIY